MSESYADALLEGLTLTDADFSNVSFRRARLVGCRFVRCKMAGAQFHGARLTDVDFEDCDLLNLDLTKAESIQGGNVFVHDGRRYGRDYVYVASEKGVWAGCHFFTWPKVVKLNVRNALLVGGRAA